MKKHIFFTILYGLVAHLSIAQSSSTPPTSAPTQYSHLEVGYVGDENLPQDVFLGVRGKVLIAKEPAMDSSGNPDPASYINNVKAVYKNDFSLFVEAGVLAKDLGIGGRSIWGLPDYVFAPDYELRSLNDIEAYVKKYKHLPGIIGENELKDKGFYYVNDMLFGQLKNLEELVLHTIEQEKQIKKEENELEDIKALIETLEKRVENLENK